MPQSKSQKIKTGRVPVQLMKEPDCTKDALTAYCFIDHLSDQGRIPLHWDKLLEATGMTHERLDAAVFYLVSNRWIRQADGGSMQQLSN